MIDHGGFDFDRLEVLPDGIEGVLIFHMPAEAADIVGPGECAGCGDPIDPGENCWGVPGAGCFHADCYDIAS